MTPEQVECVLRERYRGQPAALAYALEVLALELARRAEAQASAARGGWGNRTPRSRGGLAAGEPSLQKSPLDDRGDKHGIHVARAEAQAPAGRDAAPGDCSEPAPASPARAARQVTGPQPILDALAAGPASGRALAHQLRRRRGEVHRLLRDLEAAGRVVRASGGAGTMWSLVAAAAADEPAGFDPLDVGVAVAHLQAAALFASDDPEDVERLAAAIGAGDDNIGGDA